MTSIIAVIVVFGALIFFHELGHFLAARSMGIGVSTFSLGFGPRLFGWRGKKTDYRISLIPLGGYVMLVGSEKDEPLPEGFTEKESFSQRPARQRFVVIVAGALFNIILAWLIFCAEPLFVGKPLVLEDGSVPHIVELGPVQRNAPAAEAGLLEGDIILSLNNSPVTHIGQIPETVAASNGMPVSFQVERDGESLSLAVSPVLDTSVEPPLYRIGVQLLAIPEYVPVGLGESIKLGSESTVQATTFIASALGRLVSGQESVKNLGGPILIAQEIGNASQRSLSQLFILMALLSVNLGLLNLLPIPVLDGGHALFLIIEMITRRPLPERVRAATGYVGLIFLVGVMILATYNDLLRLIAS